MCKLESIQGREVDRADVLDDQLFEAFHEDGREFNHMVVVKTGGRLLLRGRDDGSDSEACGDDTLVQQVLNKLVKTSMNSSAQSLRR